MAIKALMCMLFNISPGPPVGTPFSVRAPLELIKGIARTLEHRFHELTCSHISSLKFHKFTHTRKLTLMQSQSFLTKTSNTSHGGRRVLRSDGLNHPKPLCTFYVHTRLDQAFLDFPQTHPKLGLGGCTPLLGWRNPSTVLVTITDLDNPKIIVGVKFESGVILRRLLGSMVFYMRYKLNLIIVNQLGTEGLARQISAPERYMHHNCRMEELGRYFICMWLYFFDSSTILILILTLECR
jgi:hypothetical protein